MGQVQYICADVYIYACIRTSFFSPREQFDVQVSSGAARCPASDGFYVALYALTKCRDGQSQLLLLSEVCQGAQAALSNSTESTVQCRQVRLRLLFEMLLQPYSAHLHRPLLATLRPLVASETLRQASAAAISQCISAQQQQWQSAPRQEMPVTCLPLAAAWTSMTSFISASEAPIDVTCAGLHLLSEQMHCALEQANSAVAPIQASVGHELKVRINAKVLLGFHRAPCFSLKIPGMLTL